MNSSGQVWVTETMTEVEFCFFFFRRIYGFVFSNLSTPLKEETTFSSHFVTLEYLTRCWKGSRCSLTLLNR